ncbi:MAG: toll/interleukin-1 receptor domain-containing protein [Anaerolineales bacterium]|nr:toll/interleukin-1 receptor domain-containing protein [Anaerolineales bacterium]
MSNYDTGAIRNLLTEVFPDADEIEFFADDYFKEVKFEPDMALKKRAHVLTQYCAQNNQLDKLLAFLQKNHPAKYAEHSALLTLDTPATPATPEPAVAQPPTPAPEPAASADIMPSTPPKTNDVFISYSRRDLAFVTQLHQELTKRGISAWFDKENIAVADHWATSIVEGIRDCKVFVLALSPDSTASKNVRKEVDLAQRYDRKIVPLLWRPTEIPVAMEYQLAGIQWIDFKETASNENFNEMADVLRRLVGGASLTEATSDKPIAKESTIPALPKEEPPATAPRQLGGLKKKQTLSPIAVGGAVISGVVTTFGLDTADQDFVNLELKWLFSAADNFLKIRRGDNSRNQPIAAPIPADAQRQPQANNQILSSVDDFDLQIWEGQIDSGFKRIDTHLKNLNILLDQEARKGDTGKGDVYLQNQIKGARIDIVKILQEMAQLMNQAYGVLVTSPNQLLELLG